MSETVLMMKDFAESHFGKWGRFYVVLATRLIIAVAPLWTAEFMLHKEFSEMDGPTVAVLLINSLVQSANVINVGLGKWGLESFPWPSLPQVILSKAPEHYRNLYCVRFQW